jgi:hypothetical protein
MQKIIEFAKVVHPADENVSYNPERTRFVPLFAKIELTADGRLSISGVVGPRENGNAAGSCGQIIMSFKEYDKRGHMELKDLRPAENWTRSLIRQFFDIWDRWHLNDMSPMCEHQRALGWDNGKELTVYHFRLRPVVVDARKNAEKRALAALKAGEQFTPADYEIEYSNLADRITHDQAELPEALAKYYMPNGPQYDKDSYNRQSEIKTAGWLTETEHPEGLMSKPCPTCGYKYGSAWLKQDVPAEVIEFLKGLPDTDKKPAWV